MNRPAAIAAASVARTSSSARLPPGSGGRSPASIVAPPTRGAARPRRPLMVSRLFRFEPVEGARDRLLPERVVLVALRGVHRRLPALVLDPVLAQVLDLVPEAGC